MSCLVSWLVSWLVSCLMSWLVDVVPLLYELKRVVRATSNRLV